MDNVSSSEGLLSCRKNPHFQLEPDKMLHHFGEDSELLSVFENDEIKNWQEFLDGKDLSNDVHVNTQSEEIVWDTILSNSCGEKMPNPSIDFIKSQYTLKDEQYDYTDNDFSSLQKTSYAFSDSLVTNSSGPLSIPDCFDFSGIAYSNSFEPSNLSLSLEPFPFHSVLSEDLTNSNPGKCPPGCNCLVCLLSFTEDDQSASLTQSGPVTPINPTPIGFVNEIRSDYSTLTETIPLTETLPSSKPIPLNPPNSSLESIPPYENDQTESIPATKKRLVPVNHSVLGHCPIKNSPTENSPTEHCSTEKVLTEPNPFTAINSTELYHTEYSQFERSPIQSNTPLHSTKSRPTQSNQIKHDQIIKFNSFDSVQSSTLPLPFTEKESISLSESSDKESNSSNNGSSESSLIKNKSFLTPCNQSSRPPDMSARLAQIIGPLETSKNFPVELKSPFPYTRSSEKQMRTLFNSVRTDFRGVNAPLKLNMRSQSACSNLNLGDIQVRSIKYDQGRSNAMFVSPVRLKEMLISLAEAYATDDQTMVMMLISKLKTYANGRGRSMERLVIHFMDALSIRHSGRKMFKQPSFALTNEEDFVTAMDASMEKLPFLPFCWLTSTLAMVRTIFQTSSKIHILEIGIWRTKRWEDVIRQMAQSCPDRQLRITAVNVPDSARAVKCPYDITTDAIKRLLAAIGMKYGVKVTFDLISSRLEDLTAEAIDSREGEDLIIVSTMQLHELVDSSVVRSNPRDSVLRYFRELDPRLVCLTDMDVSLNGPFFLARFRECLDYYSTVFDSIQACIPAAEFTREFFEIQILKPDLVNCIAKEGLQRIMRTERLNTWRARMTRAGFSTVPFSPDTCMLLHAQMRAFGDGFQVVLLEGDFVLMWHDRPIMFASNWVPAHHLPASRKRALTGLSPF